MYQKFDEKYGYVYFISYSYGINKGCCTRAFARPISDFNDIKVISLKLEKEGYDKGTSTGTVVIDNYIFLKKIPL